MDSLNQVDHMAGETLSPAGRGAVMIVLVLVLLFWFVNWFMNGSENMSTDVGLVPGLYSSGGKGRWQTWRTDPMGNSTDANAEPMVGSRPGYYFAEPQGLLRREYRTGRWSPQNDQSTQGTENFNQGWLGSPAYKKEGLSQTVEAAALHGR